jgi:hypothetical protein
MDEADNKFIGKNPYTLLLRCKEIAILEIKQMAGYC